MPGYLLERLHILLCQLYNVHKIKSLSIALLLEIHYVIKFEMLWYQSAKEVEWANRV